MDIKALEARARQSEIELRALASVLGIPQPVVVTERWGASLTESVAAIAFNLRRDRARVEFLRQEPAQQGWDVARSGVLT